MITDDKQAEQVRVARQFAKKAKSLFIPQIVQVELVWVLEAAYELDKSETVRILHHLQTNEAFQLQDELAFSEALRVFQENNVGFADSLILAVSNQEKYSVVTFDKKFARLHNATLLG